MNSSRLQTYIGVGLLVVAILAFFLTLLSSLPKKPDFTAEAKPLREIPSKLFSSDNETTKKINALNVPANVPVGVDPNSIGRANVFENY